MYKFNIELYTWAYHGFDEKQAGAKTKRFSVQADDFNEAVKIANFVLAGIRTNPAVWQAGINSVSKTDIGGKVYPSLYEMN